MFLFSLIFFIGICLAGGFNHSILIYHIRFCNNYPNNVRQALGYNITDSEFNNFRECNDEDDPNDDPFLETTNIILRKFNNNQSTEKERKALEEILTLLNTLRCNGSIFVDYNSSSGPGRFATGFKKLYYDENEIICIRSIIDLGVLQIVFISSVLCAGIILFTFAIPLRNNEEWETISNRRRNDDFYTIDSNFRRKSTLEDSGDQTDAMSLNSPVVNEKESLLSPK